MAIPAVILGASFAVQRSALFGIGWLILRLGKMLGRTVEESQRLTRSVAGLIVQEEELRFRHYYE